MIPKKIVLTVFLLSFIFLFRVNAQKYNTIDNTVLKYPVNFNSVESLAERIQKDFTSDYDKARAIYSWIALNIKYDYKAYLNPPKPLRFTYINEADKQAKIAVLKEKTWQNTFESRKAVCEGFTLLYQELASLTGLKCEVIRGDSKRSLSDIGRENSFSNHSWNMVQVDGKWILIDVTWGQGYYDSGKKVAVNHFSPVYFDTDPKYFFAKHFPDSGTYLGKKLNKEDFLNGPLLFDAAIEGNHEILAPASGIIKANEGDKIRFKIKNIAKTDLFYYLKNGKPVRIEDSNAVNGALEFEIIYDKKIGTYITFFLDRDGIMSFKILSK
ncbi:transglutaminase domain-containing protein [Flavobacterium sp. B183]|uniref:transglutaminase domain-containing protein n=1 Tax=Flavobacterium sp. B183 TaxID=907046 RepID=UPI00201F287D|nr:transglutaminase domain-containing protein [Flavobacterium sp. B183]URC10927.1 transglutaminase [Flavobacterium sp. B183]